MREAADGLQQGGWLFLTLTVPRGAEARWQDVDAAYKALSRQSRLLFKRWRRWLVARGDNPFANEWVGVVESHRSGWPHMHFAVWCPSLARYVRAHPQAENLLPPELAEHALECGWGERCTIEIARGYDQVSSYLVKLSGEHSETAGELAKLTQLPMKAPPRLRRLRSGKGFLPPRRKKEGWTGTLVRHRVTITGESVARPVHGLEWSHLERQLGEHEERIQAHQRATKAPVKPVLDLRIAKPTCPTPLATRAELNDTS